MYQNQDALTPDKLTEYAGQIGLDVTPWKTDGPPTVDTTPAF